ncbi:MAG: hypothetical protein KJ548_13020 [Actinobacteria bacterium]|nr:hypothetical protein [Actinomycetota bacterium]MCG2799666.1 hypothetical protein [Cellulomonas sp.]
MALLHRPPRLPDDQRARLDASDRRAVLAATRLTDDRWVAATRRALYVLSDDGARRWPWSQIDHGRLDPETGRLEVRLVTSATFALPLLDAATSRPFAATFRERVQSSVVHATEQKIPGAGTVQIALRRDEDGALFTQVIGDGRVDLSDERVAAAVDEAEARVREAAGLPD